MKKILITGGLGYVGSHTVVELIEAGYKPVVLDNLSRSDYEVKERIEKIVGRKIIFEQVEMCEKAELKTCFKRHPDLLGVIHLAAFLLVDESVNKPLKYYWNNLLSIIYLLECMQEFKINLVVFSSSCAVYGNPQKLPVNELTPTQAVSPYGNTKQIGEDILRETSEVNDIKVISFRYFNPIGAHESALIGEFRNGLSSHLVPYIAETARGLHKELKVFGNNWNTPDGTCIRDYIHVVDVAKAHVSAIERLLNNNIKEKFEVFNLGTGIGYSVLDVIKAFQKATGIAINYSFADCRPGDVEVVYADPTKTNKVLDWKAEKTLSDAMRDAWRWEQALMKTGLNFCYDKQS